MFRTMIEKMPYLAVPLINEVFHTSYPEDVKITQLRNEHQQKDGEIITDSCLLIGKKMYHIECQSTDDTTMAIRMIEYDFAIAVENAEKQGRRYRIEFPRSCVLFLRSSGNTPDYLEADVIFPDGKTHVYSIPAIKMADYTKDHIFEKNLLMLLPFYIMRYEKKKHDMRKNLELLQILLDEYDEIRINLEKELTETGKAELYTNLTKLIVKIADHIFEKEEDIRKGIGDVMGGKVLELESERLKAEGEARLGDLINRLIQDQRMEEIQMASTDPEKREQLYKEYGI
ncbi:hypothetical protein DW958_21690 [Ruminococcus sp. AM46-18]|nr:hypothetical protein DW958_21690 [Ruminococcus sp. AM46-18]